MVWQLGRGSGVFGIELWLLGLGRRPLLRAPFVLPPLFLLGRLPRACGHVVSGLGGLGQNERGAKQRGDGQQAASRGAYGVHGVDEGSTPRGSIVPADVRSLWTRSTLRISCGHAAFSPSLLVFVVSSCPRLRGRCGGRRRHRRNELEFELRRRSDHGRHDGDTHDRVRDVGWIQHHRFVLEHDRHQHRGNFEHGGGHRGNLEYGGRDHGR